MRVLVVDDERPCLDDMIFGLSRYDGVAIAGAFTRPEEALAAARDMNPDALFLDLCMPGMDGAELAARIHAQIPAARIVFVTAYAGALESATGIPVFGSLLKPVVDAKLDELIERLRVETRP